MKHLRTMAVVVTAAIGVVVAGCGDDTDLSDTTTTVAETTTSAAPSVSEPKETTTTADPASTLGVEPPGGPASFVLKISGWTYRIRVNRISKLTATSEPDSHRPPPAAVANITRTGGLVVDVESLDEGRTPPRLDVELKLVYSGYSGPRISPPRVNPCSNAVDASELVCTPVFKYSTSQENNDFLPSDPIENWMSLLFTDEGAAAQFAEMFNALSPPAVYVIPKDTQASCQVVLDQQGVRRVPEENEGTGDCTLSAA